MLAYIVNADDGVRRVPHTEQRDVVLFRCVCENDFGTRLAKRQTHQAD